MYSSNGDESSMTSLLYFLKDERIKIKKFLQLIHYTCVKLTFKELRFLSYNLNLRADNCFIEYIFNFTIRQDKI